VPKPLAIWIEILHSLHRDPIGSRVEEAGRQVDRKVRGSSRVRLIKQRLNQFAGYVTRCIPVKVNVERRRGTASFGIFTHHMDFRDVKDVERDQTHDEVVSYLVVERGHCRLELLRADTERRFRCCVVVLAKGRARKSAR
jgi:hypothetical protein